jgi:hypothetical protein
MGPVNAMRNPKSPLRRSHSAASNRNGIHLVKGTVHEVAERMQSQLSHVKKAGFDVQEKRRPIVSPIL